MTGPDPRLIDRVREPVVDRLHPVARRLELADEIDQTRLVQAQQVASVTELYERVDAVCERCQRIRGDLRAWRCCTARVGGLGKWDARNRPGR